MLKIVIADDERVQREGILECVAWEDLGMQVVGLAQDGREALCQVEAFHPDILITDLKMPWMDGLELSRKARKLLPEIKIIIISGYDDFELVQEAIDVNAYTYLLKPVNRVQLLDKLMQLKDICEEERTLADEYAALKTQLEQNKPLLTEKFFQEVLYGYLNDEELIEKKAEFLGICLPYGGYHVMVLRMEELTYRALSEEEKQLICLNLLNCLERNCQHGSKWLPLHLKENEFVLFLFQDEYELNPVTMQVAFIRELIVNKTEYMISGGVSSLKHRFSEMYTGYKEADFAIRQKFFIGKGHDIFYTDIPFTESMPVEIDDEYEELLIAIRTGDKDHVGQHVDEIFDRFSNNRNTSEAYVKAFCFKVMSDVYRILYSIDEKVEDIFEEEDALWDKVYRFDTIPDVRQWLKDIIYAVTQHIFEKRVGNTTHIVETIMRILEEKYSEQINIESLAGLVFLTPNYLCSIFKEQTGESIITYLTRIRMSHAQRLLRDTSLKVYEISEKVGFNNTTYFSTVFKDLFGMSPMKYRKKFKTTGERL